MPIWWSKLFIKKFDNNNLFFFVGLKGDENLNALTSIEQPFEKDITELENGSINPELAKFITKEHLKQLLQVKTNREEIKFWDDFIKNLSVEVEIIEELHDPNSQ